MKAIEATHPPVKAWHEHGMIRVRLSDGKALAFPVSVSPRLASASVTALDHIELLPYTLHWPELDEDITIESLLLLGYGS